MKVSQCSVAEIFDDERFEELIAEYAAESKAEEAPDYDPDRDLYERLEKMGVLHTVKVVYRGKMIGFALVLVNQVPHYKALLATTESVFVEKAMRWTGAGLALIRSAEKIAKLHGCKALFVSAPTGGSINKLMPNIKYRECHKVYTKML